MPQLICHLVGDYCLQNHWMATKKVEAWLPAATHATLYMMPFLLLKPSLLAVLVMWGTHLLIDRFRLAQYWVKFWGIGHKGIWPSKSYSDIPPFLAVWLLIIVDNTMHLSINYAALKWL